MAVSAHTKVCLRTTKASNAMVICMDVSAHPAVRTASPPVAECGPFRAFTSARQMFPGPGARPGQSGRVSALDAS
jgi:hypothetical protein